ncbi:hypothetical protein R83H12_02335 [Fibrobacteria bacterium R8-3-H12]
MQKMKKIHILIAFFAITVFAQQQEMPQEESKNSSVYLHPVTLIGSLASLAVENLYLPLWLNLTGEIPFSRRYALIVNPSVFWMYETEEEPGNAFYIGSGVGIRRFVNGNADGLYLQLMPNVHYFKGEGKKENSKELSAFSGINADILGYIGYSIKYSKIYWFFDFGVGYGFSHYFSVDKELIEGDSNIRFFGIGTKNGLSFDINIGVGIPLL